MSATMKLPTYNYRTPCEFRAVPVGVLFERNGIVWRKVSSRTAKIHWPAGPWQSFYFSMNENCHLERMPPFTIEVTP